MRLPRFRTLQGRIFAFFFGLLLLTQVAGYALTSTVGWSIMQDIMAEDLRSGQQVFKRLSEQNTQFLTQAARVLTTDFGFREAIASKDNDTIASALENHGSRIQADLMMFVDNDGTPYLGSGKPSSLEDSERIARLLAVISPQDETTGYARLGNDLYQVIVAPVKTPLPIGNVIAGFRINVETAREFSRITNTDISFLSRMQDGNWLTHASTLPAAMQKKIAADPGSAPGLVMSPRRVDTPGASYLALDVPLAALNVEHARVLLQSNIDQAMLPFYELRNSMTILGLIGLLLSSLASFIISRGIAAPLRTLSQHARHIASGDYRSPPSLDRADELADLAHAFGDMGQAIAERENRILELAYTDTLTGLSNRAHFIERLATALAKTGREGAPLAVVLLDLDRFRYVNESLGHPMGDQVLREVARRLVATLRQTDTVARLGGDEFAILLPTATPAAARKVVNSLLLALEAPMDIEGQLVDIHGSFGIATSPEHSADPATLMRCADIAMYKAKQDNQGFAEYDTRYDEKTLDRLSLMSELRQAVEQNQLVLFYQPKVDLKNSGKPAVEALVRWVHPLRGFIPPDRFIPFAEHTGYIQEITRWVMREGIRQCSAWQRAGLDVAISVNLSARDLMNTELPAYFAALLKTHDCRPDRICLEITESAVLDDPRHALENLKRLEATGCKLALDDYGTGYSSLAYLKQMPVSELKIDRSFVQNMVNDPNDTVIVRSTIDLAHNLGLRVVAEGVENEAILSQLCLLGCDQAQGYHFSKPVSAADFETWVQSPAWQHQVRVARHA
ncbi:MAG: EAL domain-containing protein [Thiobacillus sp.]